jgi:hypothetical protein
LAQVNHSTIGTGTIAVLLPYRWHILPFSIVFGVMVSNVYYHWAEPPIGGDAARISTNMMVLWIGMVCALLVTAAINLGVDRYPPYPPSAPLKNECFSSLVCHNAPAGRDHEVRHQIDRGCRG